MLYYRFIQHRFIIQPKLPIKLPFFFFLKRDNINYVMNTINLCEHNFQIIIIFKRILYFSYYPFLFNEFSISLIVENPLKIREAKL